ncbi:hypothetical protein [Promicromonospora sp. NFX87]|uniref:hypothetical protein n=1 Tax=Promicromonospora sp. NFX87 TaxID=3402691 RepID=UPI003AFA7EDB
MTTANTTSPMSMPLGPTGTAGIPVSAGQAFRGSWYARKNPTGGPNSRMDCRWYDGSGALLSTTTGSTFATTSWARYTQAFTAPASAAFATPLLLWSGIASIGQQLDLAEAQFELGTTVTDFTDNKTITPLAVLDYGFTRGSRNVVLELLGSGYPTVFLRPAQSRSGTLSLLFGSADDARNAETAFGAADRFHFEEPEVGENWHFIITGNVTVAKVEGVNYWTVGAEFREVESL